MPKQLLTIIFICIIVEYACTMYIKDKKNFKKFFV